MVTKKTFIFISLAFLLLIGELTFSTNVSSLTALHSEDIIDESYPNIQETIKKDFHQEAGKRYQLNKLTNPSRNNFNLGPLGISAIIDNLIETFSTDQIMDTENLSDAFTPLKTTEENNFEVEETILGFSRNVYAARKIPGPTINYLIDLSFYTSQALDKDISFHLFSAEDLGENIDCDPIDDRVDITTEDMLPLIKPILLECNAEVYNGSTFKLMIDDPKPKGVKISAEDNEATVKIGGLQNIPFISNGDGWVSTVNLQNQRPESADFNRFYSVAQCGDWTFAGANNGLFFLEKDDDTWEQVPRLPIDKIVNGLVFTKEDCTQLYATSFGGGLYVGDFINDSWTWDPVGGLTEDEEGTAWTLAYIDEKLFFGSDEGIKFSELPEEIGEWTNTNITDIVLGLSVGTDDHLYSAVWEKGVYQTDPTTNASNWTQLPSLSGGKENNRVYSASRNDLGTAVGTQEQINYFDADEQTWKTASPSETKNRTYAIFATEHALYAGQLSKAIWQSLDGGKTWKKMPDLLSYDAGNNGEEFQVRGFHVGQDGYLYAATSSGIWRWTGTP